MLLGLEIFLRRKIRQYFQTIYQKKDIRNLNNTNFVIIARNCWGGQVYQWLDLPYNTPFVGLFLYGPCYMKLMHDFDSYMSKDLGFVKISKYKDSKNDYPIGVLDDVEIHFQHFKDESEALEKWNRRKARMLAIDKDDYLFTICDRRLITAEDILDFHKLPFKNKLSFSFDELSSLSREQHIRFKKKNVQKYQMPPNGKKRFKLTFLYFDIVHWLNTHKILRTRFKKNT